jgi:hypothetical protein
VRGGDGGAVADHLGGVFVCEMAGLRWRVVSAVDLVAVLVEDGRSWEIRKKRRDE